MSKVTTKDFLEFNPALGTHWSQIRNRNGYTGGIVLTPQGIVSVYAQPNITSLTIVLDGKIYMRNWERWWGNRTIVRLAKQFAKDKGSQ